MVAPRSGEAFPGPASQFGHIVTHFFTAEVALRREKRKMGYGFAQVRAFLLRFLPELTLPDQPLPLAWHFFLWVKNTVILIGEKRT
jgi:hypothetical protein